MHASITHALMQISIHPLTIDGSNWKDSRTKCHLISSHPFIFLNQHDQTGVGQFIKEIRLFPYYSSFCPHAVYWTAGHRLYSTSPFFWKPYEGQQSSLNVNVNLPAFDHSNCLTFVTGLFIALPCDSKYCVLCQLPTG